MSLNKLLLAFKNYINDPETNIFRNYVDALLGMIILLVLPILSLISLIGIYDNVGVINYAFPIASICLAGAYDTYGRYEHKSPKNIKLAIRLVFDFTAIVLSLIAVATQNCVVTVLSPVLLLIPGAMILHEVFVRVKTAIEISKWYTQ